MKYYFLSEDLIALRKKIQELTNRVDEALGNAGTACQGGSDTFHDNFEHEQSVRISAMWSGRARELNQILSKAEVVSLDFLPKDIVTIGKVVTILDEDSQATRTFKIGSYMSFGKAEDEDTDDDSVVSYAAPLAKMLMGAKAGETKEGKIGDANKRLKVVAIA